MGRRISRTAGGTTTQFLSSGDAGNYRVYLEAQGSTVTARYGYGNALYRKDGEFPLFDGLGSERTVTNGSQTVTGTINFDGFGQTVGTTGSSSNPYMFAATSGYRSDGDAGLMHVRARYFDAQVGRFVSRDTVLTEHPYVHCRADPVNQVDPTGRAGVGVIGGIIAGGPPVWVLAATIAAIVAIGYLLWQNTQPRGKPDDRPAPPELPVPGRGPGEGRPPGNPPWPERVPGPGNPPPGWPYKDPPALPPPATPPPGT